MMIATIAALRRQLGHDAVRVGDEVPERNRADWSRLPASAPYALVLPRSPEDVASTVKICSENRQPVVPQGGMTGLCGGAVAGEGEIALSLERLTGVDEIDPATATMTVRAGTPLEAAQRAADDAAFLLPLDLGARGSCAVGGNLSTNAGGNRVIRYGMARDMVLGLEVVLADGTLLTSLNKLVKNNAGYDLKQLFLGSEGTLGIITRAVLRLQPRPACTHAALCALPHADAMLALLAGARQRLGPALSAFEIMWDDYYRTVKELAGVRAPLAAGSPIYALVESQGTEESADGARFEGWLEAMLEDGVIVDAAIARSLADVAAFWSVRDAAAELGTALGPHQSFDVGLPTGAMAAFVTDCRAALQGDLADVVSLFYGHIGDGNLHIIACVPGVEPQPNAAIEKAIYPTVRRHGGSISAEHGIGTVKKRWLPYSRTPEELALMRTLKAALDPHGILNPGKIL